MVHDSLMSWVCHVDCTSHMVDRTSVPKACYRPAAEKEANVNLYPPAVNGSDVYFLKEDSTGEGNQTMQVRRGTDTYFGLCILTHDTNHMLLLAFSESGLFLSFDLQISSG